MAIRKIATIHRYIGLSGDGKPTGVPAGSIFFEYNTNRIYITHEGTNPSWTIWYAGSNSIDGGYNSGWIFSTWVVK